MEMDLEKSQEGEELRYKRVSEKYRRSSTEDVVSTFWVPYKHPQSMAAKTRVCL